MWWHYHTSLSFCYPSGRWQNISLLDERGRIQMRINGLTGRVRVQRHMALFTQIASAVWCHYITIIIILYRLSRSKRFYTDSLIPSAKVTAVKTSKVCRWGHFKAKPHIFLPLLSNTYILFILIFSLGRSTLGCFSQINVSLQAFKRTRSWIFSSGLDKWTVGTLLRGHPWGRRGANQGSAWGSLVIMMQGVCFITIH